MPGILGVEPLDAMMGKVPAGSRILITCDPDVDGRAVLLQASRTTLQEGGHVIYVVTDRPPSAIRRSLARLGQTNQDHLHFIDAYSGMLGASDDVPLKDPADISALIGHLADLADDYPGALLCLESISSLADKASSNLLEHSRSFMESMQGYGATLALFVAWPNLPDVSRFLSRFDGGLLFYGVEDRIVRNNAIKVDYLSWSKKPDLRPRLVTVRADGGLRALVPKVAVTGPQDAGKTTFVRNIGVGASGTERLDTTVALDKGHYENAGIEAEIFGTPGQKRFDPIINTLLEQAAAVIILVDSADPDSFPRAEELLKRVKRRGLRVVMAANKQDLPGAATPAELAARFDVTVVPCTASDKASAKQVMDTVLRGVLTEVSQ